MLKIIELQQKLLSGLVWSLLVCLVSPDLSWPPLLVWFLLVSSGLSCLVSSGLFWSIWFLLVSLGISCLVSSGLVSLVSSGLSGLFWSVWSRLISLVSSGPSCLCWSGLFWFVLSFLVRLVSSGLSDLSDLFWSVWSPSGLSCLVLSLWSLLVCLVSSGLFPLVCLVSSGLSGFCL